VRADVGDAGTYGASFLRIPVGAASMSAPDIVVGMNPNASLLFSNPAVLGDLPTAQLYLSGASWLEDLSMSAASVAVPMSPGRLVWSLGTRLLYSGEVQGFAADETVEERDSYYGVSFSTAMSRRFERLGLALGAGVTYLREHLPKETGVGFAFSLGASYVRSRHRVDAFAENLGGKIGFEGHDYPIDSRYVVGYGYSIPRATGNLDLGTQVVISRSELKQIEFGGAYQFHRFFTLRAGYNHALDAPVQSQVPLTAGLGFRYGSLSLDYAYTAQEYFSNTHTFSVGFAFGGRPTDRQEMGMTERPLEARRATPPPMVTDREIESKAGVTSPAPESYAVVAGTHSRAESAEAEARALRLVKVPATVESGEGRYRVVIDRFDTREKAQSALARYESKGHRFRIFTQKG
jgi:hypothetical protein